MDAAAWKRKTGIALVISCTFFACGVCGACGGSPLPLVEIGPHVGEAPVIIPYPPPAARVEIIGKQPSEEAVWIDGEWTWDRRRFSWKRGRWEVPPKESYWAPAVTERLPNGSLVLYAGRWRSRDTTLDTTRDTTTKTPKR